MKKLVFAIFTSCFLLFTPYSARAASEFSTSFYSTYSVQEDGQAEVEHRIEIKNNLAHIYTTEYTIAIGSANLTDLAVMAGDSNVPFQKVSAAGATTLTIPIPDPVIGKDQVLPLRLNYKTPDLVEKYGSVLEINIPRLSRANEASLYTRRIVLPAGLGTPKIETPRPTSRTTSQAGDLVLDYVGYPAESITLFFGESVTYKLSLAYQLNNPTLAPADTELALPPDTEYQSVLLSSLDPKPLSIRTDKDGNWLAAYPLRSQETKKVKAELYVTVYPEPRFPSFLSDLDSLATATDYWQSKSSTVKSLAANLKTPLNIYNYLVENLTYDYTRIPTGERLGAEKALANPTSAICTEFTDSFVALARAVGIPAREINGYARTADSTLRPAGFSQDILHAWPEYYDREKKTWLQVDPTWGNTTGGINYFDKMDYGHIAFVRHGEESSYPLAAGSYKESPEDKTIEVIIAETLPEEIKTYEEGRQGDKYTLTNTGNVALRNFPVTLSDGSSHTITYLPPSGTEIVSSNRSSPLSFFERLLRFFRRLF